jgi:sigma-54 dependent transcriptional regulator, acetoin dehydrogenase operon transcriptional activator AcoR
MSCGDGIDSVSQAELTRLADQHRSLYTHAVPVMEMLHEQILNTHSMVVLTDAGGLILHTLGDSDFLEKASRVTLRPGVSWSEGSKGTNAIGTALTEAQEWPAASRARERIRWN